MAAVAPPPTAATWCGGGGGCAGDAWGGSPRDCTPPPPPRSPAVVTPPSAAAVACDVGATWRELRREPQREQSPDDFERGQSRADLGHEMLAHELLEERLRCEASEALLLTQLEELRAELLRERHTREAGQAELKRLMDSSQEVALRCVASLEQQVREDICGALAAMRAEGAEKRWTARAAEAPVVVDGSAPADVLSMAQGLRHELRAEARWREACEAAMRPMLRSFEQKCSLHAEMAALRLEQRVSDVELRCAELRSAPAAAELLGRAGTTQAGAAAVQRVAASAAALLRERQREAAASSSPPPPRDVPAVAVAASSACTPVLRRRSSVLAGGGRHGGCSTRASTLAPPGPATMTRQLSAPALFVSTGPAPGAAVAPPAAPAPLGTPSSAWKEHCCSKDLSVGLRAHGGESPADVLPHLRLILRGRTALSKSLHMDAELCTRSNTLHVG